MPPGPRKVSRVLVIEDHAPLRAAIVSMLRRSGLEVLEAGTEHGALALLEPPPDLILCDVYLPDGSALRILEAALELSPEPLKIAMSGKATPEHAFRLAQLGVIAFLPKPFSLDELAAAIDRVAIEPIAVDPLLRASVGRVPMLELQKHVRDVMVGQALAIARGSRTGAARLLDVSRQAVQQIARGEREEEPPREEPSPKK